VSESTNASIGSMAPGDYGAAGSAVLLSKATKAAAWTVWGVAASASLVAEVQRIAPVALPSAPNTASKGDGVVALWLGPQSWLLVAGDASAPRDFTRARGALDDRGRRLC